MVEASRIKAPFAAWVVKVKKGHTKAIRRFYRVRDIDRGYKLEITRRSNKQVLKAKSNIPRYLKKMITRN